ncbi:unnamed protein product [Dimorphilus gyrociliatus]|nr:unnamed protein product [Dimorphilus gyrociliatus]
MTKGVYISKLGNRGPAKESGKIQVGDKILSFTVSFENIVLEDALTIISYASTHPCDITLERESKSQAKENIEEDNGSEGEEAGGRFVKTPFNPLFRSQSVDNIHQIDKTNKSPTYSDATTRRVLSQKEIRKEDETDTVDTTFNFPDVKLDSSEMLSEVSSNFEQGRMKEESILVEKNVSIESTLLTEASVVVHNVNEVENDSDKKKNDKDGDEDKKSVSSSQCEYIAAEEQPVVPAFVQDHRIDIEEAPRSSESNDTVVEIHDGPTLAELMAKTLEETPEAIIVEEKKDMTDEARIVAEAEITAKIIEEEAIKEVIRIQENSEKIEFKHLSDADKLDIIKASYEPEDAKRMSALSPNAKSSTTVVMVDEQKRSRTSSSSSEEDRPSSTITPRTNEDDVIVADEKADILLRRKSGDNGTAVKAVVVKAVNSPDTDNDSLKEGEPIEESASPTIAPLSYKRYSAELDGKTTVIKDTNDNVTLQSPRPAQVSVGGMSYYVGLDPPQPPAGLFSIDDENESTSSLLKDLGLDKYVKNNKNDSEA